MKWAFSVICALIALSAGPVRSQQLMAPPPALDEAMVIMKTDFGRLGADISAALAAKEAEITAIKKKDADLDAYLKACGDKPGCTTPAQ